MRVGVLGTISGGLESHTLMDEGMEPFFGIIMAVIAVMLVLWLVMYILYGIAVYRIAKNDGYDKPWLAWVPIANLFMIPILVEYDVQEQLKGRFTLFFGIAIVAGILLSFIVPYVPNIAAMVWVYGFYCLANRYSERQVLHTVIAVLTGGASIPFQLFRFRNRESLY